MKKLSEYKNRDALDKLADIIEPLGELMSDKDFLDALNTDKWKAIKIAAKDHPDASLAFLAAVDGVPVEEYQCGVMALPLRMMEVFGDPDLYAGFTSQAQEKNQRTSSGPAMESTEGNGKSDRSCGTSMQKWNKR